MSRSLLFRNLVKKLEKLKSFNLNPSFKQIGAYARKGLNESNRSPLIATALKLNVPRPAPIVDDNVGTTTSSLPPPVQTKGRI